MTATFLEAAIANRFAHVEHFTQLPRIHNVLPTNESPTQAQMMTLFGCNPHWELVGTNAANAGATIAVDGGVQILTAGDANDQMILQPRIADSTTNVVPSRLNLQSFRPALRPRYGVRLVATAESLADVIIWGGLKLTNTHTVATDANSCYWRIEGNALTAIARIAGETHSSVVAASLFGGVGEEYELAIEIDARGRAVFSIGVEGAAAPRETVFVSPETVATAALKPYLGFHAGAGSAKGAVVRHIALGAGKRVAA